MKKVSFQEWLKLREVGTGTNAIAVYSRPVLSGPVTRSYPDMDGKKRKKKS
jgi:hypothetical protein